MVGIVPILHPFSGITRHIQGTVGLAPEGKKLPTGIANFTSQTLFGNSCAFSLSQKASHWVLSANWTVFPAQ